MTTNFPTSIDSYSTKVDNVDDVMAVDINNPQDAIVALENKVGVNSSGIVTSLDYLLKNVASANPGHKHTLVKGAYDVSATAGEINTVCDGATAKNSHVHTHAGEVTGVDGSLVIAAGVVAPANTEVGLVTLVNESLVNTYQSNLVTSPGTNHWQVPFYLPASKGTLYWYVRIKRASAGTGNLRLNVGSTNSAAVTTVSESFAWKTGVAMSLSGEAVGWNILNVQMWCTFSQNVYFSGLSVVLG